jgi:cell division septum initiation protein DivIVA
MAGGIDELIDVLYGMVEEAWSMPLGRDKCVVERERVLDILDELRVNLPGEIKAARDVVEKRNDLLAEGKREAESIRKQAEEKASQLLNNSELVNQAKQKANEIVSGAEQKSRELKNAASTYCDDILRQTEETVTGALSDLRQIRQQFLSAVQSSK